MARHPSSNGIRVVHLVPNLNFGGLQEVVKGLALCLKERGHDVTIACWGGPGNHPETERDLAQSGVPVAVVRGRDEGHVAAIRTLRALLKRVRGQVLHVHNPLSYYFYGTVAARLAGVPVVIDTLHASAAFDRMNRRETALFRAAVLMSDHVVSVGTATQAALQQRFRLPPRKLAAVDNGIDVSRFLTVPRPAPRPEIVFGTVGRMVAVKNHHLLIDAFALAGRKHSNIRLRLLGSGPLEPQLRQRVHDIGLADVVEFRGFSHDVGGFFSDLDVFVLSSNSEGMPLSLLEALAAGLPVVATAVGAIPEIVRRTDSGWLCRPRDAEALSAAMESAIAAPDRRERGERARQVVVEHYSAGRMAADYERLYMTLLRGRAG